MLHEAKQTGEVLRDWALRQEAMGYNYAPSRADKETTNNFASAIRICLPEEVSVSSSGLTDVVCSDFRRAEGQLPFSIWVHGSAGHLLQWIYAAI